MSSAVIPFGASGAWTLDVDIRDVAFTYRLNPNTLRNADGRRGGLVSYARDALVWKLARKRCFSQERVAQLLKLNVKAVREAVTRHDHRIREFNQRYVTRDADAPEPADV